MLVSHLLEYYGPVVKCPVKICNKDNSKVLNFSPGDKLPGDEVMHSYVVGVNIDKLDKDNPMLVLTIDNPFANN